MQSGGLSLKTLPLDAPATGCGFAGKFFACADGDGHLHRLGFDGSYIKQKLHEGAILAFATDEKSGAMYTASDDGKALRFTHDAHMQVLHDGRKWVDTIASNPRGHVAWNAGKTLYLSKKGTDTALEIEALSTVSGIAFSPDSKWLGAAVYGGALLVSVADPTKTKMLEWQGSHLTIGFSPDGRFCVTSMLENTLHVWRIDKPNEKHGKMGGYPTKPLSFAWSADGRYLASSGADVLPLWPFIEADGPIGQGARVVPSDAQIMIRSVASRPRSQHIGIGYANGAVAIYDRKTEMHHSIADGNTSGPVTQIAFSADAQWMGFIREGGEAGLVNLGKP